MTDSILVITTIDGKENAQRIARELVEKRLAACVQVFPVTSIYRWKGKVEEAEEWLCLCKTRREIFEDVEMAIKRMHTYEIPEIVALPVEAGSHDYLAWMDQEVR